jgi:hypothetical protein
MDILNRCIGTPGIVLDKIGTLLVETPATAELRAKDMLKKRKR